MSAATGPSMIDLHGRVALVTGASSGLGARAAGVLATAGAEVVLTGRSTERLKERAATLAGAPLIVPGDLRDAAFRTELVDAVRERHGGLDVLLNAAGTCDNGPLEGQSLADVADIVQIDLLVPIDLCRLAAPLLFGRPDPSVINIASIFGQISSGGGMAGYHAAKGGLITVTRHLAEQWGARGVRVNALAPGFFPTPLTGELADPDQRQRICLRTLLRRVPDIAEIDGPLLFLASNASSYVTGHVLTVDGGWTAN
ncbi:MAG TPA: SDR family oxidoreductase [Actinophytocola sp.]|nr:SDR family oxidoreductase [Actinophytocola sp.]